jgi:hypothetical protein
MAANNPAKKFTKMKNTSEMKNEYGTSRRVPAAAAARNGIERS